MTTDCENELEEAMISDFSFLNGFTIKSIKYGVNYAIPYSKNEAKENITNLITHS